MMHGQVRASDDQTDQPQKNDDAEIAVRSVLFRLETEGEQWMTNG